MKLSPEQLEAFFPYVLAAWAAIAIAAAAFFYFSKNAVLKRRAFFGLTIAADVAIIAFIWLSNAPLSFFALAVGLSAVGSWQAIRYTRFCDACGANNFPPGHFQSRVACKSCGANLGRGAA